MAEEELINKRNKKNYFSRRWQHFRMQRKLCKLRVKKNELFDYMQKKKALKTYMNTCMLTSKSYQSVYKIIII